jgi:hypothetical protein
LQIPPPTIDQARRHIALTRHLAHHGTGFKGRRDNRLLLLDAPPPPPLGTGQYFDACHCTVSCIGANTDVCTGAHQPDPLSDRKTVLAGGLQDSSDSWRKSARERDLDNFLLEELRASECFRNWFLEHLTEYIDIPQFSSVKVRKNPQREIAPGQTDLSFALRDEQGIILVLIFIESKVAGGFEQDQPERYRDEVEAVRLRLGRRNAAAVLVAPESNKAVLAHRCFDVSIRLETIIDHLRARLDRWSGDNPIAVELRERLAARIELLEALAGKRRYNSNWTPNPIPERVDFFEQYRALATRLAPHFKTTVSSGGQKSKTMLFTVPSIPGLRIRNIRHDFRSSVSLVIPNARGAKRPIQEAEILPTGAIAETTHNGTLLIRLRTPSIDPSGDLFQPQRAVIERSIQSAIELYAWAKDKADHLAQIIRSAQTNPSPSPD